MVKKIQFFTFYLIQLLYSLYDLCSLVGAELAGLDAISAGRLGSFAALSSVSLMGKKKYTKYFVVGAREVTGRQKIGSDWQFLHSVWRLYTYSRRITSRFKLP